MRYQDLILPILISIPLIVIQIVVVPFFSIDNIGPDLLLILVVYFAVKYGQINGLTVGFIIGMMFDLSSGGLLGSAMFSKTLSGFIAGYFHNETSVDTNLSTYNFSLIVLLCAIIDSATYSILGGSLVNLSTAALIINNGLFPGLYTSALSMPLFIFRSKRSFD